MIRKRNKMEEHHIQTMCVRWFSAQFPELRLLLIAVPNGSKRRTKVIKTMTGYKTICPEGNKLKEEGMIAGVADLMLLLPRNGYGHLAIEMKTEDGVQSKEQKEWQKADESYGNRYVICRSLEQFQKEVRQYLFV